MVDVLRQCLQDCFEATQSESDNYHPTFILSKKKAFFAGGVCSLFSRSQSCVLFFFLVSCLDTVRSGGVKPKLLEAPLDFLLIYVYVTISSAPNVNKE